MTVARDECITLNLDSNHLHSHANPGLLRLMFDGLLSCALSHDKEKITLDRHDMASE